MRNLVLLWIGQFISQVGDAFFLVTLQFLILLIGGSDAALKASVVLVMNTLPALLIGPFSGALVDRVGKRRLMLLLDLIRAGIVSLLPVAAAVGCLSWPLVAVVAFCLSTAATAFNPARDALLPLLADGKPMTRVNTWFQMSFQMAMIAGSLTVGLLLGISRDSAQAAMARGDIGPEIARIVRLHWVDAATFLVSFALLAVIVARGDTGHTHKAKGTWHEVREGVAYARRSGLIRGLLFITMVDNFFIMGPAILGSNLLILRTYGLGPTEVAWFMLALGVGWLGGSLLVWHWAVRWPKGKMILLGMVMDGATFIPFFWIRSFPLLLLAHAFHGIWIPFIQVSRTTLIQEKVPRAMLGRVFSLINLTVVGCTSLSLLATGAFSAFLSGIDTIGELQAPPIIYLAAGLGGAACGLAGVAFRRLRQTR